MAGSGYSLSGKRIWVVGHRGMVGAAIVRRLDREHCEVLTATREALDLRIQADVRRWVADMRPDAVMLAAARVGGILANDSFPVDFLLENLQIETNVIEASHIAGVEKLLFLGSSCIYPRLAEQPMREEALLSGALEPTNEWYAIAKIAGIKLTQAYRRQHGRDFISAMPTNLYGPGDNFDLESGHVVAATIRKAHEGKVTNAPAITMWGTGSPRREFLYVDDCADACVHLMKRYSGEIQINVGSGQEITIRALQHLVCDVVGYRGEIAHDLARPDGAPRKLLDTTRLDALGWRASTGLRAGLEKSYAAFLETIRGTS